MGNPVEEQELTPPEWQEWSIRVDPLRDPEVAMTDPLWRLCHLYKIADDEGKEIVFKPTPEQIIVIWCIVARGWQRIIIPKARQLGMSTVICLIEFDMMLWTSGVTTALVDKTDKDATKKMQKKVQYAWERLDPEIAEGLTVIKKNDSAFALRVDDDSISVYEAGTTYRGDTCQFLHISEWGWIQANDVRRSVEIANGSLPAVERAPEGVCVIETTWDGGQTGEVWDLCEEALTTPTEKKGPRSWRILFFAWWTNPGYARSDGYIDDVTAKYLEMLEKKKGIKLTKPQMLWYAEQRRTKREKVLQEYPSFIEECWEKPVPGAIYGQEIADIRASGRLCDFEMVGDRPLFTSWDLGMADSTVLWLVQMVDSEVRWLDWVELEGRRLHVAVDQILKWEAQHKRILYHFLPHDSERKASAETHESWRQMLAKQGVPNTIKVPQVPDIWQGIEMARNILQYSRFHTRTNIPRKNDDGEIKLSGFGCLGAYRKRVEVTAAARAKEMPIHDHTSHSADGFRTFCEALKGGLVPSHEPVERRLRPRQTSARTGISRRRRGRKK